MCGSREMSEVAEVIIAIGVAGLLLMLGAVGIIWAIRCAPRLPHYQLPAIIALSIPAAASIVWALLKLG